MNKLACYRHAQGFFDTGKQLLQKDGVSFLLFYFSPCVMNLSFSCELSLKLIKYIETGIEEKREHRLVELYNMLSEITRRKIEEKYIEKGGTRPFNECIHSNNDNFVTFRYLHEESSKERGSHPWDLRNLAESLLIVAGELLQEAENNAH